MMEKYNKNGLFKKKKRKMQVSGKVSHSLKIISSVRV